MQVIRHDKATDEKTIVNYPAKWGNKVVNLDENIDFYEIKHIPAKSHNPIQFDQYRKITLTENKGEFLNIAEISIGLEERAKELVILELNDSLGQHLDTNYLPETRTKHLHEAVFMKLEIGEANFTSEQKVRYDYLKSLGKWLDNNRKLRDEYENEYLQTGIMPQFNWIEL